MNIRLESDWAGGKRGTGTIKSENLDAKISIPAIYGGSGTDSNPKELFVASTAACFIATLTAIIEGKKLSIESLSVQTEANASDDDFSIVHHAKITLPADASHEDISRAELLIKSADEICTVGNLARKAGVKVEAVAKIACL